MNNEGFLYTSVGHLALPSSSSSHALISAQWAILSDEAAALSAAVLIILQSSHRYLNHGVIVWLSRRSALIQHPSLLLWLLRIDFILPSAFLYPPSVILWLKDYFVSVHARLRERVDLHAPHTPRFHFLRQVRRHAARSLSWAVKVGGVDARWRIYKAAGPKWNLVFNNSCAAAVTGIVSRLEWFWPLLPVVRGFAGTRSEALSSASWAKKNTEIHTTWLDGREIACFSVSLDTIFLSADWLVFKGVAGCYGDAGIRKCKCQLS